MKYKVFLGSCSALIDFLSNLDEMGIFFSIEHIQYLERTGECFCFLIGEFDDD